MRESFFYDLKVGDLDVFKVKAFYKRAGGL